MPKILAFYSLFWNKDYLASIGRLPVAMILERGAAFAKKPATPIITALSVASACDEPINFIFVIFGQSFQIFHNISIADTPPPTTRDFTVYFSKASFVLLTRTSLTASSNSLATVSFMLLFIFGIFCVM